MYTCPVCNVQMQRTPLDFGVVWTCPQCNGRAATVSLLRRNVQREFVNSVWQKVRSDSDSKLRNDRRCPSCSTPMRQITDTGITGPLELDACRNCQFFWFDHGEREQLPGLPQKPPEPELDYRVREILAIAKVKQMQNEAAGPDYDTGPPDEWWQVLAGIFGMPVEEDAQPVSRLPIITWAISLLILIVSILAFQDLEQAVNTYGLIPADALRFKGLTLLTSFFLHGGILHLVGNLYFFLIFGDNVEDTLGHIKFFALLVLATLVGDLLHIIGDPNSSTPCIGASGGISGVIVFYALAFPQVRLRICWRIMLYFHWFRISVLWAMAIWIGLQLFGLWSQLSGYSNVSALAHLGGAATGFLFWLIWKYHPHVISVGPRDNKLQPHRSDGRSSNSRDRKSERRKRQGKGTSWGYHKE